MHSGDYHFRYRGYGPNFSAGPPITPMVKLLLIANIACFVLQALSGYRLSYLFGLVPALVVSRLYLWQFFTYMFLHDGVWHIFINMLILYVFGRDVEAAIGSKRFLRFYCAGGVVAGVCSFLFYGGYTPIIGASGALFAVMVAFAVMFPNRVITLLLFFVFPVSMKAKHMVMIFIAIELFSLVGSTDASIAYVAHLGGALFGYLYMKGAREGKLRIRLRPRRPRSEARGGAGPVPRGPDAGLREQVDRILDKVASRGLSSLSEDEKELLRRAKDEL